MSRATSRSILGASRDSGSEVVEFTLVSILVVIMVGALFQLALALHIRNTLISCAAEGARLAATEDRSLNEGEERTESLVEVSLGGYPVDAEARMATVDGALVVIVNVTAPVPVVGLWGFGSMSIEARAIKEIDRG